MPYSGIDEMPKSQIEKRKRNMESTSRVSRREKRNVEICFLVPEENEKFCKKNREICNFLQFREEKFWKLISWFEGRSRRPDFKLFVTRKKNSPTTIRIPISVFFFCPKNAKLNLRHKRSFDAQIQNKDCVFDNTITKVQWSLIGQCNNYPFYCSQYQIQ